MTRSRYLLPPALAFALFAGAGVWAQNVVTTVPRITGPTDAASAGEAGGGGGGGSVAVLATATFPGTGAYQFIFDNTVITEAHDAYLFQLHGVTPTGTGAHLTMSVSIDNGATWVSSAYPYALNILGANGTASIAAATAGRSTSSPTGVGIPVCGPTISTFYGCSGEVRMFNPTTVGRPTTFAIKMFYYEAGGVWTEVDGSAGKAPSAVNAVRFYFDNFSQPSDGSIRVYGYTKE